jgi:membrane fusion protein YbhG
VTRPCLRPTALVLLALVPLGCRGRSDALEVAGTVEIRQVRLSALASGRLVRLLKDEGDSVRAGDTVAVLEQPGLGALIQQRRAQAQAAAARTAEVDAAQADSGRAANDLARATPLRASGVVSPQQFETLQSAARAAAARLQVVRGAVRESLAARAALAGTMAIQGELTVIAPESGVILTRYAEPGEAVAAGAPILALGVLADPWIRAFVGEPDYARLKLGQPVRIRVDGYPDTAFTGRVSDIAPRAEFTPRAALTERERADLVFAIKVSVDGGDAGGRLKAGVPVTLEIPRLP